MEESSEESDDTPSLKEFIHYYTYFWIDLKNAGFENPSLHRKSQGLDQGKVWIVVTDTCTSKTEWDRQQRRLDYFRDHLASYLTCDFILCTRQSLSYDLRQEFFSPHSRSIALSEKLHDDELQDKLVELFGWQWVFGELGWHKAFSAATERRLKKQAFLESSYCTISNISKILSFPSETQTLITVSLQNIAITDESTSLLCETLTQNKTLKRLELKYLEITDSQAQHFSRALELNMGLREFEFSHNHVDFSATSFGNMLKVNRTLHSLIMEGKSQDALTAAAFSGGLTHNQTLLHLSLNGCRIGDIGIEALLPGLQSNQTLLSLGLAGNKLSACGVQKILSVINRSFNPLVALDLSENVITTRLAKNIANILRKPQGLVTLKLWQCKIPSKGVRAILGALITNKTLRTLDLDYNKFCRKGIRNLCQALSHNTHLTMLDVKTHVDPDGSFGAENLATLFNSLATNHSLTSLSLSLSGFRDSAEMTVVGNYLRSNSMLGELRFNCFLLENSDGQILAGALKNNQTLIKLWFNDMIKTTILEEIHGYVARNHHAILSRRQKFIYILFLLDHHSTLWQSLPLDIKLHMLNFLDLTGDKNIGKSKEQLSGCAKFLFTHQSECWALIKAKQKIVILENTDFYGRHHFRFFKPGEIHATIAKCGKLQLSSRIV